MRLNLLLSKFQPPTMPRMAPVWFSITTAAPCMRGSCSRTRYGSGAGWLSSWGFSPALGFSPSLGFFTSGTARRNQATSPRFTRLPGVLRPVQETPLGSRVNVSLPIFTWALVASASSTSP
jgi:hypothetical protein